MNRFLMFAALAVCVGGVPAGSAWATPYWVAYEGNDFPENEGWERITYGGGAERGLEDGSLVLDGLASTDISDFYRMDMPGEPIAGETFMLEWRLRVDEMHGFADPAVAVDSSGGFVELRYSVDSVYSSLEGVWIDIIPGSFHEYHLASNDMQTYSLRIDGELAHVGEFIGPASEPRVAWGDATQGARSLSTWDHVRFGVVPEPGAVQQLGGGFALLTVIRRIR